MGPRNGLQTSRVAREAPAEPWLPSITRAGVRWSATHRERRPIRRGARNSVIPLTEEIVRPRAVRVRLERTLPSRQPARQATAARRTARAVEPPTTPRTGPGPQA